MADIFKHVLISDEIAHIGLMPIEAPPVNVAVPVEPYVEPLLIGPLPDGLAQERAVLREQSLTLNALLQSLPKAISEHRQHLSADIADIVLAITSKLFVNQQLDKNSISHQISHMIEQLNEKEHLEISLHPSDLACIQQGEIKLDTRAVKNLRLISCDSLRLGGCIVNSEHGMFDAGIERQIDNLKQVLLQMRSQHE